MQTIEQQLRNKGVRPTPIRTGIITLLMQTCRAYSHTDLERAFNYALDRVSLYRSLLRLNEAGLIHKHIDAKGTCYYFYAAGLDEAPNITNYPHFKCSHCETVVPLPKLPPEYLALVRQYQLDNLRLLAEGTCDDCRHRPEYATDQMLFNFITTKRKPDGQTCNFINGLFGVGQNYATQRTAG